MTAHSAPSAVIDTNVLLDWLVFRDKHVAPLVRALEDGGVRWLVSPAMRTELGHMLVHGNLARWAPDREQALAAFDRYARPCAEPPASRLRCSDRDDQIFIDLALAERAAWLITHDRALLKLARRAGAQGVLVLTPVAWCQLHVAVPT